MQPPAFNDRSLSEADRTLSLSLNYLFNFKEFIEK